MNAKQIIRLRGHHLVCLHFFRGEGYSPEYIDNLRRILESIEAGEEMKASVEADDVCVLCPSLKGGKRAYAPGADAGIREMDETALSLLGIREGNQVRWVDLKEEIPKIFSQWAARYCKTCGWLRACEKHEKFYRLADESNSR